MKKFTRVIFKTELDPLPLCNYDSEQIQHLLVQLFSNSADAKKDATIVIKTYSKFNSVFVEVTDNGPGIPDEKKNIFEEPFSSKRTQYGLFLCKSIIDRHRGQIGIMNLTQGAGIQFSIPVK